IGRQCRRLELDTLHDRRARGVRCLGLGYATYNDELICLQIAVGLQEQVAVDNQSIVETSIFLTDLIIGDRLWLKWCREALICGFAIDRTYPGDIVSAALKAARDRRIQKKLIFWRPR